jgi:hypothetical protein
MTRLTLLTVAILGVLAFAPAVAHAATYQESFELSFGGWEPRSDGLAPKWSVTRSTDRPFHGRWGLRYDVDGSRDDGTVWVQRRFPVSTSARTVELRFWMWSDREAIAGNWKIVAFVGGWDPRGEGDFTEIGQTNRWTGWREFVYRVPLPANRPGVTVAFGLSVLWEVSRTDHLDLATVTIV